MRLLYILLMPFLILIQAAKGKREMKCRSMEFLSTAESL